MFLYCFSLLFIACAYLEATNWFLLNFENSNNTQVTWCLLLFGQLKHVNLFLLTFQLKLPRGYLTTSPIHLKKLELMRLHFVSLLFIAFAYLEATNWFLLTFGNFKQTNMLWIDFFLTVGHLKNVNWFLLTVRLKLPRGYLTTSPIHLKKLELMLLHCFSLRFLAFAYLGATN